MQMLDQQKYTNGRLKELMTHVSKQECKIFITTDTEIGMALL
jgi:hypothetical protein